MLVVGNPFPVFPDVDGSPLQGGFVYIGTAALNPETSPITAYWDSAGTQPVAQPLQTVNGLIVRSGTPARVYVPTDYSMTVRNARGALVSYAASSPTFSTNGNISAQGFSSVADVDAYVQQLLTSAGFGGLLVSDQTAARRLEALFVGSTNAGKYGIPAGAAGINTPAGVPLTLGAGDLVRLYLDPTTGLVGVGTAPVAGQGAVQLLGSASGGIKLGNVANATGTVLDWYEEGTWSPVIQFGGLSVGITYATQVGLFTRIGNMVFARFRIALTSKGSSSGLAKVTGLPYVPNIVGAGPDAILGEAIAMTALAAGVVYALQMAAGSAVMQVIALDTTGATTTTITRTDAAFGNGTQLDFSFAYQVA